MATDGGGSAEHPPQMGSRPSWPGAGQRLSVSTRLPQSAWGHCLVLIQGSSSRTLVASLLQEQRLKPAPAANSRRSGRREL